MGETQDIFELLPHTGDPGSRLSRISQIARNYSWTSIARRGMNALKRKLSRRKLVGVYQAPKHIELTGNENLLALSYAFINDRKNHRSHAKADLAKGKLCLLNQTLDVGFPIEWRKADRLAPSHLWRFHLHYHEYLLNVRADRPQAEAGKIIESVLDSWLNTYSPESTSRFLDAWHPYCIARRIPTWIYLVANQPDSDFRTRLLESLCCQTQHLCQNLETDIGGNHLLEDLLAIAFASLAIESEKSEEWLDFAFPLLKTELQKQVLSNGEHFELAPTYHCQMLGSLLRFLCLAKSANRKVHESCQPTAERMLTFLRRIQHPDGEIAMLGDSGLGESPSCEALYSLADLAEIRGDDQTAKNGSTNRYFVLQTGEGSSEIRAIFDAGETAAQHLPAHGHCDLTGLEISVGSNRWFVDSGNYNYEDDRWRAYCRSSLAHNVLTIEGQNSSNVWSKFRMGDRGKILKRECGTEGQIDWAFASHNGYQRLGAPSTNRTVAALPDGAFCCFDFPETQKQLTLDGFLHLHPELNLADQSVANQEFCVTIESQGTAKTLEFFGVDQIDFFSGWYCPAFGEKTESIVIRYRQNSNNRTSLGWILRPTQSRWYAEFNGPQLAIRNQESEHEFHWNF